MPRLMKFAALLTIVFATASFADAKSASAQVPVTSYYAPARAVHYVPVRRGLLGLRRGYLPVVTATAPVAVTSYYAPPVTSYYAPAAPVTTYYAPVAPRVIRYAPVTPVTTYYAPAAPVIRAPVTTYYPGTIVLP